jgi:hypothetical protein
MRSTKSASVWVRASFSPGFAVLKVKGHYRRRDRPANEPETTHTLAEAGIDELPGFDDDAATTHDPSREREAKNRDESGREDSRPEGEAETKNRGQMLRVTRQSRSG